MSKRLPRVEENRSVAQTLLIRLYSKRIRILIGPGRIYSPEHKDADEHGYIETDVPIPKPMKGAKGAKITDDEQHILLQNIGQITTMLRYDWEYGKELIRDVYATVQREYKPARGTDLSEFEELMQKGLARLEKENMHGLWFYLDAALRKGIEICENGNRSPVLEAREAGAGPTSIPLGR